MFGTPTLTVLDLGTRHVRAVTASVARDGTYAVEAVATEAVAPGPERLKAYLERAAGAFDRILPTCCRPGDPVHVVLPWWAARSTIQSVPRVDEATHAEVVSSSHQHFVTSFATRVPVHGQSVEIEPASGQSPSRVAVLHAYARAQDVGLIVETLVRRGFAAGSILSPVLALSELARAIPAGDGRQAPSLLIDAGATHVDLLWLDDGRPVLYRKVFGGVTDWIAPAVEGLPAPPPDLVSRVEAAVETSGPGGPEVPGLAAPLARQLERSLEEGWSAHFRSLKATALKMVPRVSDEEESETPADPALPGPVVCVGGGPCLEGYVGRVARELGVSATGLDPTGLVPHGKKLGPVRNPQGYGLAYGGLALIARMGARKANLAREFFEHSITPTEPDGLSFHVIRRAALVGAVAAAVSAVVVLGAGHLLEKDLESASQSFEVERAGLPPPADVQATLSRYRDLKERECTMEARLALLAHVARPKLRFPRLLNAIDQAIPRGSALVSSVEFDVRWPGDYAHGVPSETKTAGFTLRGEARTLPSVTQFVQSLKQRDPVRNPHVVSSQLSSGGRQVPTSSTIYSFEIAGDIDVAATR